MCNERYFKVEFSRLRIWPGGTGLRSSESLYYKVLLYWRNIWDKYQKNQLLNQHSSTLHASLVEVSFLYWNINFLLLAKARRQQNISVQTLQRCKWKGLSLACELQIKEEKTKRTALTLIFSVVTRIASIYIDQSSLEVI